MEKLAGDGFKGNEGLLGPGVYALIRSHEVVYIGRARDVIIRVYRHRLAWNNWRRGRVSTKIKVMQFDSFMVRPCREIDLGRIEKEMIIKYRPQYNVVMRPENPVDLVRLGLVDQVTFNQAMIRALGVEGVEERRA